MMAIVIEICSLNLFVVLDLDLEPIWIENSFFLSLKIWSQILFILFVLSMKKVMQCTCVDFCENIRSQDMYVKCPKIQSTYFVNRDIYMYR